jgi:hypothetical protein
VARLRSGSSIFFPWERRRGFYGVFRAGRIRPVLLLIAVGAFLSFIGAREREQSGVRETRATLLGVRRALDAYMAENEGACPRSLEAVLDYGTFKSIPHDAWGNPLRLVCPARRPGERYEILSDGPDGRPGGLDRIE